jgi:hypothetical protein
MILISKVQNIIIQKKKKKTHPYKITRISFFLKIFFFFWALSSLYSFYLQLKIKKSITID